MATKDEKTPLPPIVAQVVDQFIEAMTDNDAIDDDAAKRLEELIYKGDIPKPDTINEALFRPPENKAEKGAS